MTRETAALILSLVALIFGGIGIGMNIWSLVFAIKWLFGDKGKDSGDGGNNTSNKR